MPKGVEHCLFLLIHVLSVTYNSFNAERRCFLRNLIAHLYHKRGRWLNFANDVSCPFRNPFSLSAMTLRWFRRLRDSGTGYGTNDKTDNDYPDSGDVGNMDLSLLCSIQRVCLSPVVSQCLKTIRGSSDQVNKSYTVTHTLHALYKIYHKYTILYRLLLLFVIHDKMSRFIIIPL